MSEIDRKNGSSTVSDKEKGESRINQGDSLKEADIGTIFEFAQQK